MPATDRYAAEVPVAGEDPAQRDDAIARALREVVVKVSGDPRSVSRLRAVRDPGDLVAQYQYGVAPGGVRVLRVVFDRAAVDALLRDEPAAAAAPAPEPAVVASPGERVRVQVRGIGSLATHARVTRVLQAAAGPDGVALRAVRGDLALFEVSGRAGPDQLDRLAREGFLEPDYAPSLPGRSPAAGSEAFDGVRLRYRVMQ
jgi:hypothetical protein